MIKTNDVLRVARTGSRLIHNGGTLTTEHVVRMTTSADWEGTLYLLKESAAREIAAQFNRRYPDGPVPPNGSQEASRGTQAAIPAPRRRLALAAAS